MGASESMPGASSRKEQLYRPNTEQEEFVDFRRVGKSLKMEWESCCYAPKGDVGSVGIVFLIRSGLGPMVSQLEPGSPAERSGMVRIGDLLEKIDDCDASEFNIAEIEAKLRGKKGTNVEVTFLRREGETSSKIVANLQREVSHTSESAGNAENKRRSQGVGLLLGGSRNSSLIVVKGFAASCDRELTSHVRIGDVIFEIDGQRVSDFTIDRIELLLCGEPGSQVKIKFKRGNSLCHIYEHSNTVKRLQSSG